ncbi:MAG: RhuM protein, partial [Prevotella pectinovora]
MRRILRIDERGHVRMEGNLREEVWMTLTEIADLFNLPAATVGREIKGIRKTGVLVDYEACKYIRMADGCSVDIYHWDIIVALAYRASTFYAHAFRQRLK